MKGGLAEAAKLISADSEDELSDRALVHLAAVKSGNAELAKEQLLIVLKLLGRLRGPYRQLGEILAGKQPADATALRLLPIDPDKKRVLLVLVAKKFPALSAELVPLALQLDFEHDVTSLCLRKVL